MNYDPNVYKCSLIPVLPMHILLRRFLMEWNEGNGVHTYRRPPGLDLCQSDGRRERVGKRQPVAAGNLREGELKMAGGKHKHTNASTDCGLRHSHSAIVPTLSLEDLNTYNRLCESH